MKIHFGFISLSCSKQIGKLIFLLHEIAKYPCECDLKGMGCVRHIAIYLLGFVGERFDREN